MLGHYALTLYRAFTRHRLYAALNVLGLAVGVAVFLVLHVIVRHEGAYDAWIKDARNVYLLALDYRRPGEESQRTFVTPGVVLPLLRQDYPQIAAATRLMQVEAQAVPAGRPRKLFSLTLVDPDFGRVFPLPLRAGDLAALSDPAAVAISETYARKMFGTADALGRDLPMVVEGRSYAFRVAAVFRDWPDLSMIGDLDVLVRIRPELATATDGALTSWSQSSMVTALRVPQRAQAAAITADLPNFLQRRAPHADLGDHPERGLIPALEPLREAHFDVRTRGLQKATVDRAVVAGMALLGAATLILAIVNAVNLATARAGLRAREVAVRKALGASRTALLVQFMAESLAASAAAVLIGVSLVELSLPGVNALLGAHMAVTYLGPEGLLGTLAGLVLGVGLLSGAYPALVLAGVQPAKVLAASRMPGGGRGAGRVRSVLVAAQFAVSIALIACTGIALSQADFERRADTGFQRTGLMQVSGGDATAFATRRGALLDVLKAAPGVTAVGVSDRGAHNENASTTNIARPGRTGADPILVIETVGGDYLRAYGGRLLAGRWFDPAQGLDDRRGPQFHAGLNVVLNRAGTRVLGFATPEQAVGQTLLYGGEQAVRVVGVVEDIRFLGPRDRVSPTLYSFDAAFARGAAPTDWRVAVRYAGVSEPVMQARLAAAAHRLDPDGALRVQPVSTALASYYRPDERRSRLFAIGAALAVALGCVGLYGLASFTTARRIKEIGVRKALGASTRDILRLLVGQFLRPVLWANLAAWPLAYLAMRSWLAGFDQRIGLGPQYFLGASFLALAVAAATVLSQALRVARAEPAKALRHE